MPYTRDKEKAAAYMKVWRSANKAQMAATQKVYRKANKLKISAYMKVYWEAHPEKAQAYAKTYRKKHTPQVAAQQKKWRQTHKKHISIRERARYRNDIDCRLATLLRGRTKKVLNFQAATKPGSAIKFLGCTVPEARAYLESKFQPGMTWENHGQFGWHIDHVIPLDSFDLSDPAQYAQACHYTNLQPLWWKQNIQKGNKII
jgi:hypothetical protein